MADDLDALRTLALRLLWRAASPPGEPSPVAEPELLPQQLPDGLPEIPFPEGSGLIGSMIAGTLTTIVADTALSPDDVRSFYARRLSEMDWYLKEREFPAQGGFVAVARAEMMPNLFCRGPKGPSLWLNTTQLPDSRTSIRIEVNSSQRRNPCVQESSMPPHSPRQNLIPELPAPAGSSMEMQSSGGSHRHQFSSAELGTELDLAAIATHYSTRLENGGWKPLRSGGDEQMRWSTWSFLGENGRANRGLLFALQGERPGAFTLYAQASWSEADETGKAMGWGSAPSGSTR